MSVRQMLPYTLAATLACAMLTLNAAEANDKVTFRDVLKPDGKARSAAQQIADGVACGTTGPTHTVPFMPTFEKCMNGKGWVWKQILTKYGPSLPRSQVIASSPRSSWWSESSGSSSSTERDDDQRRTDEFNRQMQSNSDSINQAIQATNDMNAAATTQAQVDQNLANIPMPPN